jgi:hypothetical protein
MKKNNSKINKGIIVFIILCSATIFFSSNSFAKSFTIKNYSGNPVNLEFRFYDYCWDLLYKKNIMVPKKSKRIDIQYGIEHSKVYSTSNIEIYKEKKLLLRVYSGPLYVFRVFNGTWGIDYWNYSKLDLAFYNSVEVVPDNTKDKWKYSGITTSINACIWNCTQKPVNYYYDSSYKADAGSIDRRSWEHFAYRPLGFERTYYFKSKTAIKRSCCFYNKLGYYLEAPGLICFGYGRETDLFTKNYGWGSFGVVDNFDKPVSNSRRKRFLTS